MKYIITESKIEKVIIDYINELFPNLNYYYEPGYDVDEDPNGISFTLNGDEDDDDYCFKWYSPDYFYETAKIRDKAPLVMMDDNYLSLLDGLFNDKWHEPFKKWMMDKFNLPVKNIE